MRCPHCAEDRLIERVGATWFCQVCAKTWRASETLDLFLSEVAETSAAIAKKAEEAQ
jgi:ribosomal protein L37AE/L43A